MSLSVLDLFSVGIGPSSSHTVGPMRAAFRFVSRLVDDGLLSDTVRVRCELFGSLGATGHGHGSVPAVVLGLCGEQPHLVDPVTTGPALDRIRTTRRALLAGKHEVDFSPDDDVVLHRRRRLDFHSNGMRFRALDADGGLLAERDYFSVGGGFVLDEDEAGHPVPDACLGRLPVRLRGGAPRRRAGDRATDQRGGPRQRARLARRARDPRRPAPPLGRDARVRRARDGHRRCAARRPAGPSARSRPRAASRGRHARRDGARDPRRPRRQRGERRGRPGGHRPHQRRGGDRARGAAPRGPRRAGIRRRRRRALPADRGRDRAAAQAERLDLRRRGRLPG